MRKLGYLYLALALIWLIARLPDASLKGQPNQLPGLKDLLVGKWQAQHAEDELMEFKQDGACIMSLKGQPLGKAVYKIVDRDTLLISSPEGDEIERFTVQIAKDELSLIQTAKFRRAK